MRRLRSARGFTLAELVMVVALIALLATIALPVAKFTVKRQKEAELRLALRQIRTAIDEYKRMSDQGIGTRGRQLLVLVDHAGSIDAPGLSDGGDQAFQG